jgi:copper transport protein
MITFAARTKLRLALILTCCVAFSPSAVKGAGRALLHAALLRSTPAANSHLTRAPDSVLLVFSEGVVAKLSQISVVGPDGRTIALSVASDPHDARTLGGAVQIGANGRYQVIWHIVSADGHPGGGKFVFTVDDAAPPVTIASSTPKIANAVRPDTTTSVGGGAVDSTNIDAIPRIYPTTETTSTPVVASLLRGLGLGGLMAGLGFLFFGNTGVGKQTPTSPAVNLIAFGSVLLIAHLLVWLRDISPSGGFGGAFIGSVFASTPGRAELLRVALALLTLCAAALVRSRKLTLVLGAACLIVSGAIGHPAGIQPLWTIPSKAIHLLAGAAWLGGLLWLVSGSRRDDVDFPAEARRVSNVALIAVILVLLSGIIQIRFFLQQPSDLIHSSYGRLASLKIIGLLGLIGLGAFNRYLLLPAVDDSTTRPALSRTVRQEIAIMTALIIIGGFLAYVPTPSSPGGGSAASTQSGK